MWFDWNLTFTYYLFITYLKGFVGWMDRQITIMTCITNTPRETISNVFFLILKCEIELFVGKNDYRHLRYRIITSHNPRRVLRIMYVHGYFQGLMFYFLTDEATSNVNVKVDRKQSVSVRKLLNNLRNTLTEVNVI